MNVEILTEAAQLLFSEHINRNFFAVQIDKNGLYNAGTPFLFVNLQDICFVRHCTALSRNQLPVHWKLIQWLSGPSPFLSATMQGPPSGYRTGFKKCSDAQQFIQLTVVECRWHKCEKQLKPENRKDPLTMTCIHRYYSHIAASISDMN